MRRLLKISNHVNLVLCPCSIAGLIFANIFFFVLRKMIVNAGDVEAFMNKFSIPIALVYILLGLSHLAAIFTLILQLNFFKRENFLRSFLFFTGIISLLMLLGDFALMSDISKEYVFGLPQEFNILFLSQALHFIFYILMVVLLAMTAKSAGITNGRMVLKDDSIFINAQYIGILSAISGLSLITIFSVLYLTIYPQQLWVVDAGVIVLSLLSVIPYFLIVLFWLIIKIREGVSEWYDEKQYQDITKASMFTMVSSVIIMAVIFIIQHFISSFSFFSEIWFPFYMFLVLLLFSAGTLYLSKD